MASTTSKQSYILWRRFMKAYEDLPALWNPADENYSNKRARVRAMSRLLSVYQEIDPYATISDLKGKIYTLRSSYRRELNKIKHSIANGDPDEEVYQPQLWYFECLDFLRDIVNEHNTILREKREDNKRRRSDSPEGESSPTCESRERLPKVEGIKQEDNEDSIHYDFEESHPAKRPASSMDYDVNYTIERVSQSEEEAELQDDLEETEHRRIQPKKAKRTSKPYSVIHKQQANLLNRSRQLLREISKSLESRTDEASIYAESWACSFRRLSEDQKVYAKKAIDDVLLMGRLGGLDLNTVRLNTGGPKGLSK